MVIVQIIGGTGSQMLAYAKGCMVAKALDTELVLDTSDYISGYKFPYALDFFNVTERKLLYVHTSGTPLTETIVSKKFIKDHAPYFIKTEGKTLCEVTKEAQTHSDRHIYLVGECCVLPEKLEGMEDRFKLAFSEDLAEAFDRAKAEISVAVHVRRGDFVAIGCETGYEFYKAAMAYVREQYPTAVFYIFSDGSDEVKKNLGTPESVKYVKLPGGAISDAAEIVLMSHCDHIIMTGNSCFSNWAVRLHGKKEGLFIKQSEDREEGYCCLTSADVNRYLKEYGGALERSAIEHAADGLPFEEEAENVLKKLAVGEEDSTAIARNFIYKYIFDAGLLKDEQYRQVCAIYGNILRNEQRYIEEYYTRLRYLEHDPDDRVELSRMSELNLILGNSRAAAMYALRMARLDPEDKKTSEAVDKAFRNEEFYPQLRKLLYAEQMNLVFCPDKHLTFYRPAQISIPIIAGNCGFDVSVIDPAELDVEISVGEPSPLDLAKWSVEQGDMKENRPFSMIGYYRITRVLSQEVFACLIQLLRVKNGNPGAVIRNSRIMSANGARAVLPYEADDTYMLSEGRLFSNSYIDDEELIGYCFKLIADAVDLIKG